MKNHTTVFAAAVIFVICSSLGVFVVPKFESIFSDMLPGKDLPLLTRLITGGAPIGFSVFGLLAASVLILGEVWQLGRWLKPTVIVLLLLFVVFVVVGLYLPLQTLTQNLS